MPKNLSLLLKERTASISDIQKNPSKALKGITRVMRGGKTYGFFLDAKEMEELLEDIEMMNSTSLKKALAEAKKQQEEGTLHSLEDVMKEYER